MPNTDEIISDLHHVLDGRRDFTATFTEPLECIQVVQTGGLSDGQLHGYVIFFSGGWDAWKFIPGTPAMHRVGCCLKSVEKALEALGIYRV